MKPLYLIILFAGLLLGSCQKGGDEPTPKPAPITPTPTPTPQQQLVGKWQLIGLEDPNNEPLSNCSRKSYITFAADGTATRTLYRYTPSTSANEAKDACSFTTEAKTYSFTTQQLVLNNIGGTATEVYSYTLASNTLTMVYKANNGATQTITYQKNYVYDPAKEILGTWYINALWRNDTYNYSADLEKFNGCRGQQKVIITKDSIIFHQYRYTKNECRESIYKGTYTLSEGLGIIAVKNRFKGKTNIGLREFRVGNGTLEFWGFVDGLAGDYENEYYKHEQKYK
ncbi:lipocalin family protein [Capnocytophaga sp. oral taxon 878]|uniref:lipocalin family protein n=1 Tax=Capnocytophaga sp. oral taxon 878 TaxID=1316596 RepID=UPI000D03F3AD|nr:lipocalin family protein [Capnocytophaga sp. oral taxon 878]AVM51232.1 hypothetical protein C4H12_12605 [Capnocytophaga sp. oral taxon 878]